MGRTHGGKAGEEGRLRGCPPRRGILEFQTAVGGSVETDPQGNTKPPAILLVFKHGLNVILAYWE